MPGPFGSVGFSPDVQHVLLGWTLLATGLGAHALGMVYLHRRRNGHGDEQPKWLEVAYWTCWVVLFAVVGLVLWLALRD